MNLLADLEEFIHDHRPHGPLTCDATDPAWNGYLLTVACPWGGVRAVGDVLGCRARPDPCDAAELALSGSSVVSNAPRCFLGHTAEGASPTSAVREGQGRSFEHLGEKSPLHFGGSGDGRRHA